MQIPLICTTTIKIPLILEIQRTRRVYLYEPREDADIEIVYLPDFEKRDRKKNLYRLKKAKSECMPAVLPSTTTFT